MALSSGARAVCVDVQSSDIHSGSRVRTRCLVLFPGTVRVEVDDLFSGAARACRDRSMRGETQASRITSAWIRGPNGIAVSLAVALDLPGCLRWGLHA